MPHLGCLPELKSEAPNAGVVELVDSLDLGAVTLVKGFRRYLL